MFQLYNVDFLYCIFYGTIGLLQQLFGFLV
jgi:hypothetical protein